MWLWQNRRKKKNDKKQASTTDLPVEPAKMICIVVEPARMTSILDMSLEESWDSRLIAHIVPDYECCHPGCPIATEFTSDHESGEKPAKQPHVRIYQRRFVRKGFAPTNIGFSESKPEWYEISDAMDLVELPSTKAQIVSVEREDSEIVAIRVRVWIRRQTVYDHSAERWNEEARETVIRLQPGESLLVVDIMDNSFGIYYEQEASLFTLCGK